MGAGMSLNRSFAKSVGRVSTVLIFCSAILVSSLTGPPLSAYVAPNILYLLVDTPNDLVQQQRSAELKREIGERQAYLDRDDSSTATFNINTRRDSTVDFDSVPTNNVRSLASDYADESLGFHTFVPWLKRELENNEQGSSGHPPIQWFCFVDVSLPGVRVNVDTIRAVAHVHRQKKIKNKSKVPKLKLKFLTDSLISDGSDLLIVHHFSSEAVLYPKNSNFLLNRALAEALVRTERANHMGQNGNNNNRPQPFVIDPLFELAQRVRAVENSLLEMRRGEYPIEIKRGGDSPSSKAVSKVGSGRWSSEVLSYWKFIGGSEKENWGSVILGIKSSTTNNLRTLESDSDDIINSTRDTTGDDYGHGWMFTTVPKEDDLAVLRSNRRSELLNVVIAVKTTSALHAKRIPVFRAAFNTTILGDSRVKRIKKLLSNSDNHSVNNIKVRIVYMTDDDADTYSNASATESELLFPESFVNLERDFFQPEKFVEVNTVKGYCRKMEHLLRRLYIDPSLNGDNYYINASDSAKPNQKNSSNDRKVDSLFVVSDDDTMWNVENLLRFLTQNLGSKSEKFDETPIYAGERYSYSSSAFFADAAKDSRNSPRSYPQGYDYITTGGGMVVTKETLRRMFSESEIPYSSLKDSEQNHSVMCRSPSEPDDMALGRLMQRLKIPATHHTGFRQRRPWDYPTGSGLEMIRPISYHNIFSQTKDPVQEILRKYLLKPAQQSIGLREEL